jgi:hypothetical protein
MCRSIKILRGSQPAASEDEIRAAALQFVRKISGYRVPSRANQPAFDAAVAEIAASSRRLLDCLPASPRAASTEATIPRSISKTRSS